MSRKRILNSPRLLIPLINIKKKKKMQPWTHPTPLSLIKIKNTADASSAGSV